MDNEEVKNDRPEKRIDHDSTWKDLIDRFFYPLLEMALPELYRDADTTKKHELLDKEFRDILNTSDPAIHTSPHFADYVIKVPLKNGGEEWLIVHIEIQGEGGIDISMRMFHYQSMIFDHYMKNPVALAIITDKRPKSEAEYYSHSRYGTEVCYRYNRLVLSELDDEELLKSDNPIALAFYAGKLAVQAKEEKRKYEYLRKLTELLAERGWGRDEKRDLVNFLVRIVNLRDKELLKSYWEYRQKLAEEGKIMYEYEKVFRELDEKKAEEHVREEIVKELVRNFFANGVSPDVISRSAGVPIERVHTLVN